MRQPLHRAVARQRGFSLFEILLSLMVMGLSVGLGVSLLGEQLDRDKSARTLTSTERVAQALGAFLAANKRLPCPADPDAATLTGTEVGSATCASKQRGLVPWSTLGLQRRDVEDGYGRLLTYHVDPAFTVSTFATLSEVCSASAVAALKAYVSVSGTVAVPTFSNPLLADQSIGFVLLSHGPNGYGARVFNSDSLTAQSLAAVPGDRVAEAINALSTSGSTGFVSYIDRDIGRTESDPYDDVLFYKALPTFVALYSGSVC